MTIPSRRLRAVLALMLLAGPAWAQEGPKMDLLYCVQGQGCWQGKANLTAAEARALLGPDKAPADMAAATHRLVQLRGVPGVIATTFPADMLHGAYGGTGEIGQLVLSPGDATVRAPGKVFTPADLGQDLTIPLFDPAEVAPALTPVTTAGAMVPLDGTWRVTPRDQQFQNCNPMMESMLGPVMQAQGRDTVRDIQWGGRFDPAVLDFLNGDGQKVEWTRSGPNSFTGRMLAQGSDEVAISSDVGMRLLAPDHIEAESSLNIGTMLEGIGQAEMEALGLGSCFVRMVFDLRHQPG